MDKNKISIIIPVYNAEKYIEKCLNSIQSQTYQNYEIILIDDGSNDGSLSICQTFAQKDERIKIIHQENQGPSKARNEGLKLFSGEYLTFIDADDVLLNSKAFENILKIFEEKQVDAVFYSSTMLDENGNHIQDFIVGNNQVIKSNVAIKGIIKDNFLFGGGYPWNKMWKIEKKPSAFDETLYAYEDKKWVLEQLLSIKNVFLSDEIVYGYYERSNSLVHDKTKKTQRKWNGIVAYKKITEEFASDACFKKVAQDKYADLVLLTAWIALKQKNKELLQLLKSEVYDCLRYQKKNVKRSFKLKMRNFLIYILIKLY